MDNWELAIIGLVATFGGIAYAFYFWLDSGEKFSGRRFGVSVMAALFAGVGFGIAYTFVDQMSVRDLLQAFISGIGVTAVGSKVITPKVVT
jgi:hypothetical protein